MFAVAYHNTMRNARFIDRPQADNVRSIEKIRAEKRRERELEAQRHREEQVRQRAEAERNLAAVRCYRCINVRGEATPARDIIRWVAEMKGVTVGDILGHRRNRELIEARFDAIKAVADARPDLSLPQIGRIFGRDHTSILHALRQRGGRVNRAYAALESKEGRG